MSPRRRQYGVTTVEFAIVGIWLFVILFAVIEFGRIVYTLNMLQEGARRAARVAVVCRIDDPLPIEKALFANLPGQENATIKVDYLDANGGDSGGSYSKTAFVRVTITGYTMQIAIPLINPTFVAPSYSVTLPRESLGIPRSGESAPCD